MRTLNQNALNEIAQNLGTEPIYIIEVEWVMNSGIKCQYSDKDIPGIPGKILEVSTLDNVINISSNSDSQEITVTLDDTDGSIKNIMDTNDIHLRNVWVYQWFEGLMLNDKFLLFQGKINSPIIWNEGDRTVSLTVISQLEDTEIGFSPEEGEFNIPQDLIGQPWPMVFGTVQFSKTLRLTGSYSGILGDGIGIPDFTIPYRIRALETILDFKYSCYAGVNNPMSAAMCRIFQENRHADPMEGQMFELIGNLHCQLKTIRTSFRVFGGENFPRGTINLRIGNSILEGHFDGNIFTLHNIGLGPLYIGGDYYKNHPDFQYFKAYHQLHYTRVGSNQYNREEWGCPNVNYEYAFYPPYAVQVKCGEDCSVPYKYFPYPEMIGSAGFHYTGKILGDNSNYIYLAPGSRVELANSEPQRFIVSIIPGTVLKVTAWAQKEGQRFLQDVPKDYYTVENQTFGTITAVIVTLNEALSKYEGMGWEDDIFVTFQSSVGPNTVDILQYLIETYTDFDIDAISFNAVRTKIDKYPSHFPIYDRKNILTALNEISWQACCALYLKNGKFYIIYLPDQPTALDQINRKDILTQTLELGFTPTENLVTKMICEWRPSPIVDQPYRSILRYNVKKYGLHDRTFNFYIYNFIDVVIKNATFWLIRYANTWKKIFFSTPLTKLNLETFDPIDINLIGILANQVVLTLVEKVDYDSANHSLNFECWTPVKAGEMEPYYFAWPAQVDQYVTFPTDSEIQQGFMGSGNITNQSATGTILWRPGTIYTVTLPDDPYNQRRENRETGEETDERTSDRGNPTPSNIGDVKPQTVYPAEEYLGPNEPGPQATPYEGEKTFDPDGYGNEYPGGQRSNLQEKDINYPSTNPSAYDPNDLPLPGELEDDGCLFSVYVWYVNPVTMVKVNGQLFLGPPGTSGELVNGELTPLSDQEIYVFNSCNQAEAFKNSMENYVKAQSAVIGQSAPYMVSGPYRGYPGGSYQSCSDFECPKTGQPDLVGYKTYSGSQWGAFSDWAIVNNQTNGHTIV